MPKRAETVVMMGGIEMVFRIGKRRREVPGWERLSVSDNKCDQHWRHRASGWRVQHCGHPTALYSVLLIDPEGFEVVSHNGQAFGGVRIARAMVEGVLEGRVAVTSDRCVGDLRRTPNHTSGGELLEPTGRPTRDRQWGRRAH